MENWSKEKVFTYFLFRCGLKSGQKGLLRALPLKKINENAPALATPGKWLLSVNDHRK